MITTTTPTVEGKKIVEYKRIVFGEVISGVNFIKDFAAGLSKEDFICFIFPLIMWYNMEYIITVSDFYG